MNQKQRIGAILLMGGEGLRFGTELPKQFIPLGTKKIYEHALDALKHSSLFDEIVLVCHPDWMNLPHSGIVKGGNTRQQSSYLGLKGFKNLPDIVLIHDAVRPFVSQRILSENIQQALLSGAADTCIPSADTLVYAPQQTSVQSIPHRTEFLRGQTPQTFRIDWILEAHEKARADGIENATDDCSLLLRLGKKIAVVQGEEENFKITSPFDLLIANAYLQTAVQVISTSASKGS